METVIDDKLPEFNAKVSENKSGARTVNGRSLKESLYDYRRKYGEEKYRALLKKIDEMPDVEEDDLPQK